MKENILYSIPPKTKNKINPLETCRNAAIPTTIPQQLAIQHIAAIPQHSIPKYNYRFTAHHHPFPPISSSTGHHAIFPHTKPTTNPFPQQQLVQSNTPAAYTAKTEPIQTCRPNQYHEQSFRPPWGTTIKSKKEKGKKTRPSRCLIQWRAARYNKTLIKSIQNQSLIKQRHTGLQCLRHFGFAADPKAPIQKNFKTALENLPMTTSKQPSNLTFHNLCTNREIPTWTRQLLGLNLKHCLSPKKIPDNINKTIQKAAYSIRTAVFLNQSATETDSTYVKQIYIKNKQWNPPPASLLIENYITEFEKNLKLKQNQVNKKNKNRTLSNLTLPQLSTLRSIKTLWSNRQIKISDRQSWRHKHTLFRS